MTAPFTGGCQCGAVRYRFSNAGRASICHCRMCQKAMGNYFAPLVEVEGFEWTRGKPGLFASSNLSSRGFCPSCGTPLTLHTDEVVEVAIGSLDDPSRVRPTYQVNPTDRHELAMRLDKIAFAAPDQQAENDTWNARIVSHQHPDHDTDAWEVKR